MYKIGYSMFNLFFREIYTVDVSFSFVFKIFYVRKIYIVIDSKL